VIFVNFSARSFNYLHTHLRWFQSHYVCFVQHSPNTHKACYAMRQARDNGRTCRPDFLIYLRELPTVRRAPFAH